MANRRQKVREFPGGPTAAFTVEERNRAVGEIAESVQRASSEAQGGAAADVKLLADTLSIEAESLNAEVHRLLGDIQAV